MADPLSIVFGTVSLVDVCVRAGQYLALIQQAAGKVEEDIAALQHDIDALTTIHSSLREVWEAHKSTAPRSPIHDAARVEKLWSSVGVGLQDCQATIELLDDIFQDIVGRSGPIVSGRYDKIKKAWRRRSKDADFQQLRRQVSMDYSNLQMLLTTINFEYSVILQQSNSQSFQGVREDIRDDIQNLGFTLQSQIASLRTKATAGYGNSENASYTSGKDFPKLTDSQLQKAIESATDVVSSIPLNKHLYLPQSVSNMFTGRESLLEDLKNAFDDPANKNERKCFVLYGLGGSGKSQFCCKFAQKYKQSFWGIFWIDASTKANAKSTFATIARIGGVEPNELAIKSWLSTLPYPWLLLVDNADDPKMAVQDYFPDSEKGLILVTTRNPANKLYGTIGQHFFHFERLEPDEANELLLRAAGMPTPWNGSTKSSATQVATELGCLPLALVAAGRAILNGLSTLAKYLEYYKRRLDKVRKDYRKDDNMGDNMDDYMSVYATFEIILQGLEQKDTEEARDALQLLKIFSFFHYENIRIEILIEAANTPAREQELEEAEKKQAEATNTGPISKSWKEVLRKLLFAALEVCLRDRSYPVLPDLLRDVDLTTPFDDLRLRAALKELTQSSLITYHDTTETGFYSMHPLVHSWVRQRPSMRTWEQAIWCQAARTTLSQAILFPFPGSPGTDGALLRDLLPHIIYARQCQNEINSRILTAREKVKRWYPMLRNDNGVTQRQAREMVKFSIAYSHGGLFSEAAVLQRQVKDYVSQTLGPEHPKAMLIMLALAETYYQLGRHNDCADLHDPVLQTRLRILGPMHPDTLRSMDKLAFARCHQGRYLEGEKLSRKAIAGMTATLGANHEDTLTATDNLGRVLIRYFRAPEAIECHSRAVSGFASLLGAEHTKTLAAKESLSVAYIETQDPALLREAHALMEEVFRSRRKTLGKEHPYTLLAKFNLARVKDALGLYAEAESLLRDAVSVATRNLGEEHLGVVAGRFRLAEVLSHRGRYEEAERMFASVTGRKWYIATAGGDGDHPDRIMALYSLVGCFQRQGKWEDGLRVVEELEGVLRGRSSVHPIVDRVAARRAELEREEAGASEVRQRGEVDLAAEISSWPARQVTW